MTIFMCSSGAVMVKAGAKVASGAMTSGMAVQRAIEHGQAYVNAVTGINFNDQYADLDADTKVIIDDAVSSHAAAELINYDMRNYPLGLNEPQAMVNFNWAVRDAAINLLKEKKVSEDLIGGTK